MIGLDPNAQQRPGSFKSGGGSRWTLRDLGNQVLREYANNSGVWSVKEDFIHRGGQPLAAETSAGVSHFHLDHLGTPRLITNQSGVKTAYHVYWPYGEELTSPNQDSERMKFTGHERDLNGAGGVGDDLDYMHARFCSPVTGRFLAIDRARGKPTLPLSWNRYLYSLGNPQKFIDPNGRAAASANSTLVVRVNIVYSSADRAVVKSTQTLRDVTESGIQKARNFFGKAGIALDVRRFEGEISFSGLKADGPVRGEGVESSLGKLSAKGNGLTVLVSGDYNATGKTAGVGGPTAMGVQSDSATLTDELAHAMGNILPVNDFLGLANTITDTETDANEGRVALGLGLAGPYEAKLRRHAAKLGCAVGASGCVQTPK